MSSRAHFTPALFSFFEDLKANNNREWFTANKDRYQRDVKEPLLGFIADFSEPLSKISSHFVADPRSSGGSMFRIYRDVRFAKDKSPYKTFAAAQFRHKQGRDVHAPGFYVHLDPGAVFVGAGLWHPDGRTLSAVRQAIVEDPETWKEVTSAPEFSASHELGGDSLKRAPRGYDPDHPLIEDLKRKDFVTMQRFSDASVFESDFLDRFVASCRAAAPFARFLTTGIGLPF